LNIFRCNSFAFCEIFFQKFLRIFHFDDDDDEDEIYIDSKKKLVLTRKENW
jgi:hypothetical protein